MHQYGLGVGCLESSCVKRICELLLTRKLNIRCALMSRPTVYWAILAPMWPLVEGGASSNNINHT